MDKSPKQPIRETRLPVSMAPGMPARYDYEYEGCGVCNVFMAGEPLAGKRMVKVTERRTKRDWAQFIKEIADQYRQAEKIPLAMDNLITHKPGSLYEVFSPGAAKGLWDRFEFIFTPKHGSWLNLADIELNVFNGQGLNRRIDQIETVKKEVEAWQEYRNGLVAKVNWRFTNEDARIRLKRLYPTLEV